ncbi:MAG: OmpA family protein [Polyangiales bacterium]
MSTRLHKHGSRSARAPALAALAALVALPFDAGAQVLQRFALRAELGVGTMIPDYQRNTDARQYGGNTLGYDSVNFHTHLRLAFTLVGPLAIQATFTNEFFPTSTAQGTGRVMAFEGGLRFEPRLGRVGDLFVDGNVGYALTGPYDRLMLNAGLGFEFRVHPAFSIGPVVRITDVFQPAPSPLRSTDYPYDAVYWSAGLSLSGRVPPVVPVYDTDCDTVPDPEDVCATVPQGPTPDPNRRGCPMADTDGDCLIDPDDRCPTIPEGDYPDPARPGCPDPDRDHDAVLNEADVCPEQPKGDVPDPARAGCPHPNPLAVLRGNQIQITRQVHFDNDRSEVDMSSADLTRQNHELLNDVLSILNAHPELQVEVAGFTDNQCRGCAEGAMRHNLNLSRTRAEAIMNYLTHPPAGGAAIAPDRLRARGYGPASPIGDNATEEGRQRNRRVELRVLNPTPPAPTPTEPVTPHPRQCPPRPAPPARPCTVNALGNS